MSTVIGQRAEAAAADYLSGRGFQVVARNWRTKWCEIDLIAVKDHRAYFIEVKYRGSAQAGSGLDYITAAKLRQLKFAAELWIQDQSWSGEYELSAVELTGEPPRVINFLPGLT
ncbi:MAG TPA: YraN family protein [Candidatus Saccharimonadales bacterium]